MAATTTTSTTTTAMLELTMTLTPARSAETNQRLVAIAQISDGIASTIVSLQQMRHYGSLPGQTTSAYSSVPRLAATLSSIRKSLERIRSYLMHDETTVCTQFNQDLDVCTTTGRTFVDKLAPIVSASAPPPPPRIRLGNVTVVSAGKDNNDSDSDAESLKGGRHSRDEKLGRRQFSFDIDTEERDAIFSVLARFQPFADHLQAGLGALLKASGYTSSLDQELLLSNYASRETFREISEDLSELVAKFSGDQSPSCVKRLKDGLSTLGSLLLPSPAKPATVLKKTPRERPIAQPISRRQSISRANTWPLLKQLDKNERSTAREAREARKRSQLIDKQLEADLSNRSRQCVMLTVGSNASMTLLMDRLMAKSTGYSTHTPSGMEPISKATYIKTIRQQVMTELEKMVDSGQAAGGVLRNPEAEAYWSKEELTSVTTLHSKLSELLAALKDEDEFDHAAWQELLKGLETLWVWDKFRDACKMLFGCFRDGRLDAYNMMIMDAVRRVTAPSYVPSPADYHRFYLSNKGTLFRGTLDFDALSVTWVDLTQLSCCSPALPKKRRDVFQDATTFIKVYDLAEYDVQKFPGCSDEPYSNALQMELAELGGIARSKNYQSQMSFIAVFSNVELFREKLARKPLSKYAFPDYLGEDGNEAQTLSYLMEKFRAACTRRELYIHIGEPGDPETADFILGAIKDTKLNSVLDEAGVNRTGEAYDRMGKRYYLMEKDLMDDEWDDE